MAERPLYTLYKNLKAQNYDVPNDYNKFESALTRDGKSGADNRHAIYENLKAQNFDVPDTYERFYTALFEPRSKTSSRAKGGSVPMSAADRARFLSGAAAISASAKQIANNAGRYNRLKQRNQKQQKDFGRVNLGTHLTPFGGDANNVVKDDFSYNPETGKTGAYVTSDNENAYTQSDAEQKQAILDEQNNSYQQAVDTGEIPSVLDVRDKNGNYDLQENIGKNGTYLTEEGAQRQFDKKLADAYARKKEIEALIAEDNRQHGNPLLSYGASIGAGNGRTAEQSDYRNKLATSLSLITEQIGALEAVKQYPTSSWGEDALKALDNTAFTAKTWDFGLTDFAIMGQMERIKTKMDNNIPLSGSDKILLKSKLGADAAAALEDEKMGNVYRWTKIAGQSLPFMADFFLTGGYGGITKGISRGTLKFAAKRGMGKVSAAILKNTGIVAGDVIGSYAMAGTEQALKTGADIMQRHLGNLYQDEKGVYKFGTFDENGNLLHEGGESIGTALYKGMTSAMVENYTEKLFGHNYGIKKGAVNFMEKHGMNASAEFFKNIGKSGWYTNSKKWMEKFGINGFAEEVMEEEIGIPLHALLDGEGKVSDILDAKQQLDIIGGMAISVGSMYAMGAGSRPVKGIYNRAQYYRFRNKVNVADSDAQNLMGDNWADIKDKIDNATNEHMGGVLADILRQRDTMTKEQINAAVNYGVNLMKMRGYNIAKTAEMNAKEITNEPTTPEEQHQADIDNAYSEGHDADDADKHDIQLEQNDKANELAAMLNITPEQLHDMADEDLEAMNGQDDKLDQAIYDYQVSTAKYQGVMDEAQDEVDMAAHQAAMETDNMTDLSRGTVRKATFKATGGLEDYEVYIISGNIATHDDGSIDVGNSDDMIIYYDPTTGRKEHADAMMFADLIEELPAADVKAQAINDAKENAIKKIAGIIDGTVDVGSQFSVTDADGTEHTYEVLADNGDGTAMITIDGNVPTELVKGENVQIPYSFADLQQMKDIEDQNRLEAAKAEREQMEKEREAQKTQETEQTQPSFDFNQILNDNGNVVLADVLGKDGNTKYPNSQLFLIRDSGAKAKVVELTSDGSLIPHAVNKKDVRTATTMTLDEYKQAFAASSMIEDNSGENRGEIEAEPATIEDETTPDVAENTETTAPSDETAETPSTEQTPSITLEDGTIVPMLEDGNPDFSKLTAAQTAELYDNQFGEDADSILSGYVSDAKKALDKANNMTVKGKTFVEQKASKDAKEKAIADAQAAYDSAIAIRDAYNERQLAKVEDTAEGRKNLIEKARRKFARLKSAVKDDAEAVAQIYKETVGSLLHRLYDGTGIDVTDTNPLTAEEYVASNLSAHTLNYEGTETSKGVKQETGLSREDFAKTQLLAADDKGTTIDALVHSLWENRPSNLDSLDTQDIRNALIGVLTSGFKASEARSYVENIRIAQAEKLIEEERTAAENAAYYEQQKAKEEEEKKKAEENIDLPAIDKQGEPINNNIIELAKWAKKQGLEIDPTSKLNSYADLFLMCKDGFGVSTLVPDEGKNINQVIYFPDNAEVVGQLGKLQEEFNAGRDLNHSSNIDSEITEGATFYDAATAKEFRDFANEQTKFPETLREGSNAIEAPEDSTDEKPFGEQLDETNLPFSAKENGKQQTTAERADDVEKNKVDDMKVVDNIVGKKTRKSLEKLAKMMGANVQWQYSDKNANGWFDDKTNTIYLTLDSSITEGVQFIFGHEMTHEMRTKNPAAYDELKTLVKDMMGEDAFNSETDRITSLYNENNVFYNGGRTAYEEEVVADQLGKWIRDANYAHTLLLKMSHPLLAKLHEIVNKFLMALRGIEISDDMNLILRSIEQAYVKTANGQVTNPETGEDVSFSLRQKPEPKKKGVGYKVFVLKDGKLYPPMVANPNGAATPVGVWLDADAAPIAGESKTGRPQVKQGGKGTQGGSGKLAYRPGWHLGVVPYAIQFNRKDADGNKTLFPKNFVFAEVEYAADVDYQEEARQEGINSSGKYQHSLAGLKHLPTDGYYMYRTNPNPETDPWVITGAMKVNRILTRAEQAELVKNAGREPQQIQEGDIVTDDVVNSINQEIADAPKFSLKVYHGSGADFTEFDFDHMGEGAGSQAFGWGGYVTSSEKIARGYTSLAAQSNGLKREELKSNISRAEERLPFMRDGEYKTELKNEIKQWQKELANLEESKNLYEVDIPEDNGSNYLNWDKPLSKKQQDAIREGLEHLGVGIKTLESKGQSLERTGENVYNSTLYIGLTGTEYDLPEKTKGISKFLSSVGFTGIKYKAGRNFGGAKKGDVNYVIFKPEDMRITEHTKFSIKTYHGSQASFDHFDHSFMGSGEGAQAYGWGTYVTEVEGIAKAYAKQNSAKRNTEYSSAKFEYDTAKSSYNFAKGTYDFRMQDIDKLNNTLKWAKKQLVKAKESNRKNWIDEFEARVADTERALKENQDKLQDEKAEMGKAKKEMDEAKKRLDAIPEPERNLYTVEIPDDTGSNYIEWDGKAPDGLKEKVLDRLYNKRREDFVDKLRKAGFNDDQIKEEADYTVNKEEMADTYLKHSVTGGGLYRDLSYYLGEQKKASLFLKDMGIDGVKVIAKRNAGGNKEGKMNYVIFDENNAQITNHTKFSLRLKSAIEETETNPSDAQKESGNYKKGHIKFGGYDYTIENPKGSTRSGKDADGKEWKITMHDTYGYIRGKFGKDGDHLDMFINDKADLDNWDGDVFVVDQVNPDGSFDEHKVMYGYDSMDDAEKAYLANYSKGWKGLGNITGASKAEFDKWLDTSNRKLKPFADYAKVKFSLKDNQGNPLNQDGTLKLDKIKSVDELTDEDFLHPTRNVELPSLPKKIADTIGTEGKPVVIKKNIFERNYMRHKDVTPELSKVIFKSALYNPDLYGQNQKKTRPYNLVLINTKDEKGNNRTVLLEVNPNKDNVEIVHWHFVDERGLEKIKKQADREGGQLLILPSDKEEVGALSDPTVNLSAAKIDNSSETTKENGEKFSLKDDEYLKAVENGDMEKAQKMVNEAAEAAGYSTDSSYQGTSAFNGSAPWGNGYFLTKEERKEAWDNDEYDGDQTLGDYIHRGIDAMNLDFIALDPRNYRAADPMRKEAIDNVRNAIQKKSETITMYRSVPSDVKEGSFRNGDWVTPSRAYAVENAKVHGWGDNFNIIEQKVPVDEIWWDGNDIAEWGYGREEDYVNDTDFAYKNTKNNRKLLDAVTYDDNGNVIPPSKRFNSRKSDIRFSLKEEKEKIVADAKANGTYMTAPNGEKTKLDAEQWVTVRTTNFKNWFGDWENDPENASKVVDENGEPMVVWHGRSSEFNTFEKKEGVRFIMGIEDKVKSEGFFFSPDKGLAEEFASNSYRHRGGKANVVPCFLNIRRPMDLTGEDYDRIYEDVTGWKYMVGMDTQDNLWGIMDEEGMNDKIKEKGYDGAIFVEEVDDSYEPIKISYCALDANQIKSAENNNGDFSADNNDIRFSLAGERGAAAADKADERTFRMDNLYVAKDMEKNKKKAKAIKVATGWERGADGKWRYEMPDVVLRDPKEWVNKKALTLSDIVEKPNDLFKEYPDLFDAYPELKDMKIIKGRAKSGGVFYNNAITLNLGDIREAIKYDLDTHYKLANNSLKKTLVHEIQHYIQEKEGFAQGGNSEMIVDKNALDAIAKLRAEKDAVAKEFYAMSPAEQQKRKYEINNRYNDLTKQIERLEKSNRIGYDGYKRIAGEVEARNVSARMNMTPEERRKTLAESTEDVARKDQIFLGVGDVPFSLRDMADGKESGAADMAEEGLNGNNRFSLRYDKFEHDLNQWKKDNNLPKDAQRPTIPQRNVGESSVDFLRRVDEYRKQMALWKTAPTYEQHLLSDDTALGEFNRELQKGSVLKRIAFQDSMLAIRKAQEAIMKEVGVDRLNMAEDAYTAENRSHGKGKNEFEEYNNEFLQPLRKAYHQMKKVLGDSYDNVRIYMMAKHGLERDAQMAFKKSLEADYEDVAQRSAAYKAYKGDINRIINDSDLEFGRIDFTTWRQRDNVLRAKYSPSYMNYRYDKDGTAYDYSGLSALFGGTDFEEAASKMVWDIESSHVVEVQDLWDATNAATKKILRDGYKAGMMSKDTYQYVRDMYSHYIPLRGWDGTTADQVWDYVGGGKGAFNQTLKTAHGRTSISDDPIAYIENMAESGILLNNKNWVKQHLMLLAQNHPTSLLTLSKAWYVKSTDANGNEEWIPATPQITSQMDSNQVKAAIDAFEKKMEQMDQTGDATQQREGLNIAYPQTHSEEREHEVRVMKDGEEYVIYVNGDPQLAQAMNNTRAHRVREIQSGKLDRAAAWLGRKMAAAYTSLSPLFIPSNYFRDLTMTLASTAIREDAKYNYLLRKNLATSWNLGFMLRDYQNGKLREKVNNGNATPKEQMFYDFMMNGGETGFVSSLDVEDLKKKFKNDLKDLDRWKANPVKVGHTIMDSIEFLNRAIEDSNRFAIYMTSIQYGRSIDESVNDAKNVTLNFNRKGTGEYGWQMIRNLYLFINPAVQSLQTLGALAKHHPFKFSAVTASWIASGVLVPIVNAALMSLCDVIANAFGFGGDDDKDKYISMKDKYWQFTKWDRRNNLIMYFPFSHEFVKIPLAQEFRAFYGLGDMIASKMMGGELAEESWSQYAEDLLGQVVDMLPLDPTGYDGNIAVSMMPNAIRPVFELAFNVDFTGKPLFKDTEYNKYDPNFTKAYVGTPDWLVRASRMMNSIGNDYPDVQQNKWDALGDPRFSINNPAVVDHVLSSYLGGAYTMGSQVLGLLTKSLNDQKEIKVADIPLVSKFVSNPDDRPVSKKQGDEFWEKKEYYDRASNTISKLKKQAKIDGDYSLLERFYGSDEYKTYKLYEKDVKDYKEARKKERAEESGDEYRPHQLNAEDIYNNHTTSMDEFEDMKMKQLFEKLNSFKTRYEAIVDNAPNESDAYYNTNKAAIDAIDEISLDKQEISELKKGFLDDGKDAYNADDMKRIRELRKRVLAVLDKANKVVVANQKAKKK